VRSTEIDDERPIPDERGAPMNPSLFIDPVVFSLGPLPITESMLVGATVSVAVLALGRVLARAVIEGPTTRLAALARLCVRFVESLVRDAAGTSSPFLERFAGALFSFIAGSALIGQLPGVTAPTAKLPVAAALAVVVFVAVPVAGIHARGLRGYLDGYFEPSPFLFPFHVVSEFSRTLALALRLFGNMMSGHLVVGLLVALVGLFVPVPLMALDLLIGLLQAYIFTILACVYVGAAIRAGGES